MAVAIEKQGFTVAELFKWCSIVGGIEKRVFVHGVHQPRLSTAYYHTCKKSILKHFEDIVRQTKSARCSEITNIEEKGDGYIVFEFSTDAVYQRIEIQLIKYNYKNIA